MFPSDENQQDVYQQYAQAADQGAYSQIDHNEAASTLQQFAQNAPPDLQQLVQELPPDVQEQLDPSDPQALAQGFAQVTQQRPNLLQEAGSVLKNPVAKVAVAGLAAVAAKHVWDQHQQKHGPSIGDQGGYGQDQAMGDQGGFGQDQTMSNQRGYGWPQDTGGQGDYE